MKRYARCQCIILLSMSTFLCLQPMEIQPIQEAVCYFSLLPVELWNYIVQFLLWETEEEFIQRTETDKDEKFPEEYYTYFGCENSLGIENIVGVFSPDKNKIALFERFCESCCLNPHVCNSCVAPKLIIVDLNAEKEEDKILSLGTLYTRYYRTLGISCSGNMYAVIKRDTKNKEISMDSSREYQDLVVIHDIKNGRERTFEIPDAFIVSQLMFNKQNSCVIAYAHDFCCKEMQKNYLLFDLKMHPDKTNNVDIEIVVEEKKDKKNQLLDYFRHHGVCREIKESKKYYG